jgi:hypothetical protein
VTTADFYLASSEGFEMENPRACREIARLRGGQRDDYLLVQIDPPLIGQAFGLGGIDIEQVIVATRHQGESLFPIKRWPVYVHVARLLVPFVGQDLIRAEEMESIAWAELYETRDSAEAKAI